MKNTYIFILLLLISNSVYSSKLPDELFNIKLLSKVEELKGNNRMGNGISVINGVNYVQYSIDHEIYEPVQPFNKIIVMANKDNGVIVRIEGIFKLEKDQCISSLKKIKEKLELLYNFKFNKYEEKYNHKFYSIHKGNMFMILECGGRIKTKIKLALGIRND